MENVIQGTMFGDNWKSIGQLAASIVDRVKPPIPKPEDVEALDLPIELVYERKLRAAAFEAHDRGAEICLIRTGLLVRKGPKSEIVRYDQVASDVLSRALNRVAPHAWEAAGFDRP